MKYIYFYDNILLIYQFLAPGQWFIFIQRVFFTAIPQKMSGRLRRRLERVEIFIFAGQITTYSWKKFRQKKKQFQIVEARPEEEEETLPVSRPRF